MAALRVTLGGKPLASEEAYREAVWRVYPEGAG